MIELIRLLCVFILVHFSASKYAWKDNCRQEVRQCYQDQGQLDALNKVSWYPYWKDHTAGFDRTQFCRHKDHIFNCMDNVQCSTADKYAEVYKYITNVVCSSDSGIDWNQLATTSDTCMNDQTKATAMYQNSVDCRAKFGFDEMSLSFNDVDDVCSALDDMIVCDMKGADLCGPEPIATYLRTLYRTVWTISKQVVLTKFTGEGYNCEMNIP